VIRAAAGGEEVVVAAVGAASGRSTTVGDTAVSTVLSIYEAFGRGDVPTILGHLADDVRWDHGMRRNGVPYLVAGTGHEHVAGFFGALGAHLDVELFEVTSVVAAGDEVMTRIRIAGRNRITGLAVEEHPEAHHWRVGGDGKVVEFTHIGDWAAHEVAAPGAMPPGAVLHAVGDTLDVEVSGGQFEVFTLRGPRDSGPPPHSHPWREVYVGVSGETEVTVGNATRMLRAGQVVCAEAGTLHSYRIASDEAAFVVITGGGRASGFFSDLDANAPHGMPDAASLGPILEVAKRNGLSSPLFDEVPA
jgi:uncharacterized protein